MAHLRSEQRHLHTANSLAFEPLDHRKFLTVRHFLNESNMVSIKIKWNKTSYDNVVIDVNKGVSDFKSVVHGLTGVPPDRQKLMAKGAWIGTLKDDAGEILFIPTSQQRMIATP